MHGLLAGCDPHGSPASGPCPRKENDHVSGCAMSEAKPGPLAGIKILDLTTVVLGPLAAQILGDLGAEVIKIEAPEGDIMRYAGPARHREMGHVFLNLNRNKRSLVLDLKQPDAKPVLLALVRQSDVLMHLVRIARDVAGEQIGNFISSG